MNPPGSRRALGHSPYWPCVFLYWLMRFSVAEFNGLYSWDQLIVGQIVQHSWQAPDFFLFQIKIQSCTSVSLIPSGAASYFFFSTHLLFSILPFLRRIEAVRAICTNFVFLNEYYVETLWSRPPLTRCSCLIIMSPRGWGKSEGSVIDNEDLLTNLLSGSWMSIQRARKMRCHQLIDYSVMNKQFEAWIPMILLVRPKCPCRMLHWWYVQNPGYVCCWVCAWS